MSGLTQSRNTPEWNGGSRFHYQLLPVEASTNIFVGGMVAKDASGNAVPAQIASGTSALRRLKVLGICEYAYAGGILPPGLNALNQSGNGALYPGANTMLGSAGALSIGVVAGTFGMDQDNSISATNIGDICFAVDDHTVSLGTLVANTTEITLPASGLLAAKLGQQDIVPGTFDAYSATGGDGTHYVEGTDYTVDYRTGIFYSLDIAASANVYVTYYYGGLNPPAGTIVALEGGLVYVSFLKSPYGLQ